MALNERYFRYQSELLRPGVPGVPGVEAVDAVLSGGAPEIVIGEGQGLLYSLIPSNENSRAAGPDGLPDDFVESGQFTFNTQWTDQDRWIAQNEHRTNFENYFRGGLSPLIISSTDGHGRAISNILEAELTAGSTLHVYWRSSPNQHTYIVEYRITSIQKIEWGPPAYYLVAGVQNIYRNEIQPANIVAQNALDDEPNPSAGPHPSTIILTKPGVDLGRGRAGSLTVPDSVDVDIRTVRRPYATYTGTTLSTSGDPLDNAGEWRLSLIHI